MAEEIRVGDRFLVEVEVVEVAKTEPIALCRFVGEGVERWLRGGYLLSAQRLPRTWRVGDRVVHRRACIRVVGRVEWVGGGGTGAKVLVAWPEEPLLEDADDLVLA